MEKVQKEPCRRLKLGSSLKTLLLDPCNRKNWDTILGSNNRSSFFHTSNWANVLSCAYRYKPEFLGQIDNQVLSCLLPLMAVNSRLTGRRLVSLPFTDSVDVLASKKEEFDQLFDRAVSQGKSENCRYIELRCGDKFLKKQPRCTRFLNHRLFLDANETRLFKSFRNTTQRNIKKAEKNGIRVEIAHSINALRDFYRLNCAARKEHGLPPQPFSFFERLQEHVLSEGLGLIVSGLHGKKTVAANIYFIFNHQAVYKYGANDRSYAHASPSYLVMWEAIRHFLKQGIRSLDFGRTEVDNAGLLQFKRGWGTEESPLEYYRYDLRLDRFIESKKGMTTSYPVFRHLPVPALRLIGKLLYRHVG